MTKKSVFCITASRHEAAQIVERLRSANFSNADVSVLLADGANFRESPQKAPAAQPAAAVTGDRSGTGALVGGALPWAGSRGSAPWPYPESARSWRPASSWWC